MEWERIERWDYVVDGVAAEYARKFDMVEPEDIRQALYEWFVTHPNKLTEWESLGERDAKNLIYRSLRNKALDYCQRWKAKSLGYAVDDLYYYTPEVIETFLPAVLRHEYGLMGKLNLGRIGGRPSAPSEGGNLMVMMLEIDNAYWKLGKDDRHILALRHAESMDFKEMANMLALASEDAARMRHNRAVARLVRKLGGFRPHRDEDSAEQVDDVVEQPVDANEGGDEGDGHE